MPSPIKYEREQRFKWYLQVLKYKRSVKETCKIFGISRKTYYKWKMRDYGKRDKDYAPEKRQPNTKLTYDIRKFISEQKIRTNYGPLKMKMLVRKVLKIDMSTTIIYRYYKRKKLIRKPQKKLPWYEPMKSHLLVRNPGEGVQMDIKYVYENGKRRFQFSVLDPYTEKYHFTIFDTKESKNAIIAFKNAEKYFGFKIVSVQSDNGGEFRGEFHGWLTKNNITHYFIPKRSPYWNAQVERVHKTIDDEYYQNPFRVWRTVDEWLHYYNFERLHLTLNGLTPQEKLLQSVTLDC